MTNATRNATRYAVFGPGWGGHYLAPEQGLGSGHLAYEGPSLLEARRVLERERHTVALMRRMACYRHVADTYALYRQDEAGRWTREGAP